MVTGMQEQNKQHFREKLEQVQRTGVDLFLEGEPTTPDIIVSRCVCENSSYMADYVLDDKGILKELRYDWVTDWQ